MPVGSGALGGPRSPVLGDDTSMMTGAELAAALNAQEVPAVLGMEDLEGGMHDIPSATAAAPSPAPKAGGARGRALPQQQRRSVEQVLQELHSKVRAFWPACEQVFFLKHEFLGTQAPWKVHDACVLLRCWVRQTLALLQLWCRGAEVVGCVLCAALYVVLLCLLGGVCRGDPSAKQGHADQAAGGCGQTRQVPTLRQAGDR